MNKTTVKRISFGFPINMTQEININDLDVIKKADLTNNNLHLKITLEEKLKKNFNSELLAEEIKNATHANKVKISFIYNNEALVRSKEVSEAQSLSDKFVKYAELNEIAYKDSVIQKIESLQENMLITNSTPSDSYTLEYMSLRGAIGIRDGQHKDEFNIDLKNNFTDGIIAIMGRIGAGKSSIIENMQPFPQMITRKDPLKEQFCLKDSHRILIYRDSKGNRIRITMLIDGCAKSVMNKYMVETQKAGSTLWEPDTSLDGGFESYKAWCESKFGSLQMFMRTSYSANQEIKAIPDLSNATKSEKMTLFSVLAGIDYLGAFSENAKKLAKEEEKTVEAIKGQLQNFDNIEQRLEEIGSTLVKNKQDLENYKKLIEIDNQELDLYNEEQKKYLAAAGAYDIIRTTLNEKKAKLGDNGRLLSSIEASIEAVMEEKEDEDLYREQLKWYEENMAKQKILAIEKSELEDQQYKLATEIDNKIFKNRKIQQEIDSKENEAYKIEIETKSLIKTIPETDGNCPVCGAPLSQHKKEELEKEVAEINNKVLENTRAITGLRDEIKTLTSTLVDVTPMEAKLDKIKQEVLSRVNDISDITTYSAKLDIDKIKDVLNNSQRKLDDLNEKKTAALKEQKELESSITEMEDKMTNIPTDYSDKIARLTRGLQDSQQQIATLTAENSSLERELRQLDGYKDKVKEIKAQIKSHQQDAKDYTIIANAFGNDGIQSLELDSAAPEISDITNTILKEIGLDYFTVSFDTQRDSKSGKKKIDDFIINVFDSRSGRMKRLDLLSKGEGTLIKQSLYYAFSVIRARRTGFCFKTRFLDEADGALDSDTRVKYLKMIEIAHKMCNATQTILITHSQEIKEIVDQKIELS